MAQAKVPGELEQNQKSCFPGDGDSTNNGASLQVFKALSKAMGVGLSCYPSEISAYPSREEDTILNPFY